MSVRAAAPARTDMERTDMERTLPRPGAKERTSS